MAQKTQVIITDDIDGSGNASTVSFGLDGQSYEIDLSNKNADKMRKALRPYVDAGRKVSGGRGRRPAKSSGGVKPAEIRAWAKQNGFDVPDRGRIPSEVREAYDAADK